MNKFYPILAALLLTASTFAQTPEKISYQTVVRDANNALVTSASVGVQITILQGSASGTVVYKETHTTTSNANGLLSLEIGEGTTSDDFSAIDWADGPYFIKREIDPVGGAAYAITGTSELLSVPYALHAKTAENGVTNGTAAGQMQYWDGTAWAVLPPTQIEGASLQLIGGLPTWTGGTPFPPTIGTATGGNAMATVAFTAPASDGGATITGYTVTSSTGGITATGTSSPIIITGLTNETAYTFTVTATNSAGTGAASTASNSVTPLAGGVPSVTSANGRIWMARNLGATRVAESSTDMHAYGDLYQWGRRPDLAQLRMSATTHTQSSSATPGPNFLLGVPSGFWQWWYNGDVLGSNTNDWDPNPNDLWKEDGTGVNEPCPNGYRLPTKSEWEDEVASWSSNNPAGAFASPLKLPMAGNRKFF